MRYCTHCIEFHVQVVLIFIKEVKKDIVKQLNSYREYENEYVVRYLKPFYELILIILNIGWKSLCEWKVRLDELCRDSFT